MSTVIEDAMIKENERELALSLYKQAVTRLGSKHYCFLGGDSCLELFNCFRSLWCMYHPSTYQGKVEIEVFANSYRAFNFANIALGTRGRFVALAETLIPEADRRDRKALVKMSRQMNGIIRPERSARRKTAA